MTVKVDQTLWLSKSHLVQTAFAYTKNGTEITHYRACL